MRMQRIQLVDDLDNTTEASDTLRFTVAGTRYEIDLSTDHLAEFDQAIEPFVQHARKIGVPRAGRKRGKGTDPEQLAAMRSWARENGYEVSDKGRVPVAVQEAYMEAQKPKRGRKR